MKIKSLQLKNFKSFTDLTLQGIPDNAKLVLLIGSNGSGKSSVFDAFEFISNQQKVGQSPNDRSYNNVEKKYYNRNGGKTEVIIDTEIHAIALGFESKNPNIVYNKRNTELSSTFEIDKLGVKYSLEGFDNKEEGINLFYGRSAVRYFPRIERTVIGTPINVAEDADRPAYYIDKDNRFENDIDLLLMEVVKNVFSDLNKKTNGKIDEIKKFMERINEAFSRIFNSKNFSQLQLINFETPADGKPAQLLFKKGTAEINYDLLSAGEKEIVNLLVNLYTRARHFTNTIYFFDEIDAHLNTKLQYTLLKEIIENWIPENCQFWTASHSLGFIQYAKESENAVIFDLDDLDFDFSRVLTPEPKDNPDLYEIAVSKAVLPALFKNFKLFFVEGGDKKYYGSLNIEGILFIPEKNRDAVFHKAKSGSFNGIVDRDFLTDDDIQQLQNQYKHLKVLGYYCIENYLFHPKNLEEFCKNTDRAFDKNVYENKIAAEKEILKHELFIKVASIRQGYPYFKEMGQEKNENRKRFTPDNENYQQSKTISNYLDSNIFEDFYKSFSMKDFCKSLDERQNISPTELSKTNWFKTQIEKIIQ